jgi:hypothetical protein
VAMTSRSSGCTSTHASSSRAISRHACTADTAAPRLAVQAMQICARVAAGRLPGLVGRAPHERAHRAGWSASIMCACMHGWCIWSLGQCCMLCLAGVLAVPLCACSCCCCFCHPGALTLASEMLASGTSGATTVRNSSLAHATTCNRMQMECPMNGCMTCTGSRHGKAFHAAAALPMACMAWHLKPCMAPCKPHVHVPCTISADRASTDLRPIAR